MSEILFRVMVTALLFLVVSSVLGSVTVGRKWAQTACRAVAAASGACLVGVALVLIWVPA